MNLWRRLSARWPRLSFPSAGDDALVPRAHDATVGERRVVTTGPAPLAEMYADVLRAQGVPVMLRAGGAGRGALGGAPVEVAVIAPAEMVERACDILGLPAPEQAEADERKDGGSR